MGVYIRRSDSLLISSSQFLGYDFLDQTILSSVLSDLSNGSTRLLEKKGIEIFRTMAIILLSRVYLKSNSHGLFLRKINSSPSTILH